MRRCVGIFMLVCLMAGSAFATNSFITTGNWSTASNWNSNVGGPGILPDDTEQVKITGGTTCTLNSTAVTFNANKVTVGTSGTRAYLNIVAGGSLTSCVEIQVGDSSGKIGTVTQTGGTVSLNGVGTKDSKLEIGYKTDNATANYGQYIISGGSLVTGANSSQLLVGCSGSANGGNGTFTVQGTGGSISVTKLYVATQDSAGTYYGTGNLGFEINGGVSAINTGSVYIDPAGLANAVANLYVTKTGALPIGSIVLINNTGTSAVSGAFDNQAWGSTVTLGGVNYTLSKVFDAVTGIDGAGNDVALVIPEPATVALLGLGLLAIRRNKK